MARRPPPADPPSRSSRGRTLASAYQPFIVVIRRNLSRVAVFAVPPSFPTANMPRQDAKAAATNTAEADVSPAKRKPRKKSMIEHYYNIDENFRMLGALASDPNFR